MPLRAIEADTEVVRNLAVRVPTDDELQHLALADRESGRRIADVPEHGTIVAHGRDAVPTRQET